MLTDEEKNVLKLIQRSPRDESGWSQCGEKVWKCIRRFAKPELLEFDDDLMLVRLSYDGSVVVRYLC